MSEEELADLFVKAVSSGEIVNLVGSAPDIIIDCRTGSTFWKELAECGGWRLQKNMNTPHYRILDPEDQRRAWGSADHMARRLSRPNKD